MRSLRTSQMLLSLDFWLLFVQFTVASGVCLAYLNNLVRLNGMQQRALLFLEGSRV
jgi:hypothetical protein